MKYEVVVYLNNGERFVLAVAELKRFGWVYIPMIPGRKGSRKFYATPADALRTPMKWNSNAVLEVTK